MNQQQIEVYGFFKEQYPDYLLLFLVKEHYEIYGSDALVVSVILEIQSVDSVIQIPANGILDVVGRFYLMGYKTKLIVSRNAEGERDIPDVSRISMERDGDY